MFFESILVLSFFGDPAHKIILNGALELGKPAYKKITINPVFTRFIAFLLRKMGLEPTRHECHKILSLARLPVPTLPHFICFVIHISR